MKKAIATTIIILSCCCINAQIVFTGTVYDKDTNQPIPDVYVSFNRTIAYAITDDSGKFELTLAQRLNTQLVFSHIAYEMVIIENPFDEFPEEIYMEQRLNMLSDVVVSAKVSPEYADPFTRAQKLKIFREQFLGTTRAGKACIIMNESDIELRYDIRTNTLLASSDNPVVVLNEYLGYLISFSLVDFRIEYAVQLNWFEPKYSNPNFFSRDASGRMVSSPSAVEQSLILSNSYNVQRSYYTVISSFADLSPNDIKIKKRRDEIYDQSSTLFFKNLVNNTLEESDFRIFEGRPRQVVDQSKYFTIDEDDKLSLKRLRLIPDAGSIINVRYRNKLSILNFHTDTLLVDRYGNIDQFDKVLFTGMMGDTRVGDMLPLDYEP